jgi:hypothetical protein
MKNTILSVTREHLDNAEQQDACKCPIALSLKEKGATHVKITAENIRFNLNGKSYMTQTPIMAARTLIKFDQNRNSVKPFKVSLTKIFSQPIVKQKRYNPDNVSHTRTTKGTKRAHRTNKRIAGLRKMV